MSKKKSNHIKIAKNIHEAWEMQETYKGRPHGSIQWKGTDVCMDVMCKCGQSLHVDGFHVDSIKCAYCGTAYMCSNHIELIQIKKEPIEITIAE